LSKAIARIGTGIFITKASFLRKVSPPGKISTGKILPSLVAKAINCSLESVYSPTQPPVNQELSLYVSAAPNQSEV